MKKRYRENTRRESAGSAVRAQTRVAVVDMLIRNRTVRISMSIPFCMGLAYGLCEIIFDFRNWFAQ